ncbi:MAG: IS200/IS605 family transposase [Cytophagaceae bacterium]
MPQSLVKNYVHLIFSTKYRDPLILPTIEDKIYGYLSGICQRMECPSLKIGGYTDHIHILCNLSQKIPLMKLLEELKATSSKWMKTQGDEFLNFYWQRGYGAFSVNPSHVDIVVAYIENQKAHHANKSFQEEYRSFLRKYKVDYDERYVWD